MGWKPGHDRIKPRYNPRPSAREMEHREWVKSLPCYGCAAAGPNEAHHILEWCAGKRWRRDHRCIVPVCPSCHRGTVGIHGLGSEADWCRINERDTAVEALRLEAESIAAGRLERG